jgi:hypothetical protein
MLIEILKTIMGALRSLFRSRAVLLTENLVLRQQIVVLQRSVPKPRIRKRDRVLLALAARIFGEVVHAVTIVRPETVVRWHRSFLAADLAGKVRTSSWTTASRCRPAGADTPVLEGKSALG